MKKFLFALLFLMSPLWVFAADTPVKNAGFVQSNIWYSKDPFYAGDKIRIYTIIFNGSSYDLSGDVDFLDNGTLVGKTNFSLSSGGRVQDVWVDWKPTQGAHTITARLVNVIASGPNGKLSVSLDSIETGKSERVVAIDPVVAEAQAKEQAQKIADAGNQALGKVEGVINTVSESIPAPVKEGANEGVNIVERFRVGTGYSISLAKEEQVRALEAINARPAVKVPAAATTTKPSTLDTISSGAEKPIVYVKLAVLTLLQYLFEWQILFYSFSLFALYLLAKWGIRRYRDR